MGWSRAASAKASALAPSPGANLHSVIDSLTIILDVPIEPMLCPSRCAGLLGNRDTSITVLAFKFRDATEKEGYRDKVGGSYSNAKGQLN